MELFEIEYPNPPKYYSISRLKTYGQCSEMFRLKYIEKVPSPSLSQATLVGSLCHDALEVLHSDENPDLNLLDILKITGKKTLRDRKVLQNIDSGQFTNLYHQLLDYAQDSLSLYERASEHYCGSLPIRKRDNTIATSPTSTSGWKQSEKVLKLPERRERIDQAAATFNPELESISLSSTFAEAWMICFRYSVPPEIDQTLAVELAISDYDRETNTLKNPVLMPSQYGAEEEIFLVGFVDWIGYVNVNNKRQLAILDYKSSKETLEAQQIEYNVQLYSYVYAYETLTNQTVDLIGIHNLRANKLVMVPVDRNKMETVLNVIFSKHKAISANLFHKQIPDTSYSQCLSSFGKPCVYLSHCYPELYKQINPEKVEQEEKLLLESLAHQFDIQPYS